MTSPYKILQIAVAVSGVAFLLIYPLAVVWPSGWAWESGAPYQSHLFMMIVAVYATLGIFLLNAARDPQANLSLIWFTAISSVVHSALMALQSFSNGHHMGHLLGDVPALLLVGVVLAVLVVASGLKQPSTDRARLLTNKDVASPA
ncbi:MAG: DUF6632 domain-containing protein [Mycobacterium sp.]